MALRRGCITISPSTEGRCTALRNLQFSTHNWAFIVLHDVAAIVPLLLHARSQDYGDTA